MNQLTGAEAAVRMLELHGVQYIFGLCGDTSLPFYDALHRLNHGMTHILTRDERSAGYMADCYARVSGRVGVCEGPSGGGATYILPGIVEANESSIPVLAITSDISVTSRGRFTLTELDQKALFRPLTKWNTVLDRGPQLPRAFRAAFAAMTTGKPGSAHIGLPFDVQKEPVDEADIWADASFGRYPSRRIGPDPDSVRAAAEAIVAASYPVIVCGGGVVISGAERELIALAEALQIPVATSISGQGSIADDHPLAVGVVGSNGGTIETRAIVDKADLVIFIGCRAGSVTTERWRFPAPGKTRIVHIDVDPTVFGVNYATDAAIQGDAKLALAAIAAEIARLKPAIAADPARSHEIARAKQEKFAKFRQLAASDLAPITPERVVAELQAVLPGDAVVVADPGTPCPYLSAYFTSGRTGRQFISNRAHGALGYSMSGVVGAHYGRPGAKCVAVMGDGSFGFTSGELETIVRLKVPVTMVVISNAVYGWIKAGQKTGFGQRYFAVDFSRTDHARVAEAFGVKAWRVERPEQLKPALAAAAELGEPAL
ncbi:MAG: thiamine pyrophosphate-binding protein, partial [Proteobacteria bacterium]|nr:thiamine pyrophosphate-binding protein [Pseudomonadota bacterium]